MHTESWMFNSTCSILTVTDLVSLVVVICDALHESTPAKAIWVIHTFCLHTEGRRRQSKVMERANGEKDGETSQ